MLEYLVRPFSYLLIEHQLKRRVDWFIPLVLAALSVLVIWSVGRTRPVVLYGDNGLVSRVLGFVQNLPGFYIAALAAIATFNRPDIDRHMPEPAPKMDVKVQGKTILIKLTRRRFLCSMFAFLTAESILLVVLAIAGLAIADPVKAVMPPAFSWLPRLAFFAIFMVLFWQMIVATFWGLYYLGEKLHQPDQTSHTSDHPGA